MVSFSRLPPAKPERDSFFAVSPGHSSLPWCWVSKRWRPTPSELDDSACPNLEMAVAPLRVPSFEQGVNETRRTRGTWTAFLTYGDHSGTLPSEEMPALDPDISRSGSAGPAVTPASLPPAPQGT